MYPLTARRAVLVAALLLSFSLSPSAASAQAAVPCTPGVVVGVDGMVELSGTDKQNTRPFDLTGGAYTVRWSGKLGTTFGGNVIMHLKRTDGAGLGDLLVNTIVNKDKPEVGGETQLYNVKAGAYYLDVTASGPWSATISPQQ